MRGNVEVRRLLGFRTANEGPIQLFVEDTAGRELVISIEVETLTALLITLARMASKIIKRWQSHPQTRIAYPAIDFDLEVSQDGRRILTFGTQEGFTISFSLSEQLSENMGHAHLESDGQARKP
jgi:hypothetical protein